jgi:salicylate hydroxylase
LQPNIKIAGGGIAGLTLALALAKKGMASIIYEKRASISDEGYGIQLSPNALYALGKIDVYPQGFSPVALRVYTPKLMATMQMQGFLTLSRAALVETLLQATSKEPLIKIIYNTSLIKDEGKTNDVIIDATGINSPFRHDSPLESGYIAWRKLEAGTFDNVEINLSASQYFVKYQVAPDTINIVYAGEPPVGDYQPYSVKTRRINYKTGNIIHIGDASHAMLPNLGQGAAMAIEDAVLLANNLNTLDHFIALRTPRVQRVMKEAWLNSKIYQLPPPLSWVRDAVMARTNMRSRYDWLYGYKV